MTKPEFVSRHWLNEITDSYEDAWVSARVDAPETYNGEDYHLSAQLNVSDGSHTAAFYLYAHTEEEVNEILKSLKLLANTVQAFIDKVEQGKEKLTILNTPKQSDV